MAIVTVELLALVNEGLTGKQIAARLGVSRQRISVLLKKRTGQGFCDRRPPPPPRCRRCDFDGPRRSPEHRHDERMLERARQRSAAKFWSHVVKGPECWEYRGTHGPLGYARSSIAVNGGGAGYAHRVSYILSKGPIPVGLTIDHLCRNRGCVNPDHLEPVTSRENIMRSPTAPAAINARKTHCVRGHVLVRSGNGFERWCECRPMRRLGIVPA